MLLFMLMMLEALIPRVFCNPQSQGPPGSSNSNSNSATNLPSSTSSSSSTNSGSATNLGHDNSQSSPLTQKQSTTTSSSQQQQQQQQPEAKSSLVQVYEHEHFSKTTDSWQGGRGTETNQDDSSTSASSASQLVYRWTSSPTNHGNNVKILPPPSELSAPKGYAYIGEWKIHVSSSTKDELGWEYYVSKGVGKRRRRWLRTVVEVVKDKAKEKEMEKEIEKEIEKKQLLQQTPSRKRPPSAVSWKTSAAILRFKKIIKGLTDSFNFKGFGVTTYKSLISNTVGIGWRIPLSANFDFWESRPFLPLCNCAWGLYYPVRFSFSINASMPVVLIQTALWVSLDYMAWMAMMIYSILWQTLLIDLVGKVVLVNSIKAMGRLLALGPDLIINDSDGNSNGNGNGDRVSNTDDEGAEREGSEVFHDRGGSMMQSDTEQEGKQGYMAQMKHLFPSLQREYPSRPKRRRVAYSTAISDRLGVNVGMHLSKERGVEIRCAWYHVYLPTIEFLNSKVNDIKSMLTKAASRSKHKQNLLPRLLGEKFASLGIVWGCSSMLSESFEQPMYSCSSIFSLSGLYPGETLRKLREMKVNGMTRVKLGKQFDSRLKKRAESKLDDEYEEILEVKVGAS